MIAGGVTYQDEILNEVEVIEKSRNCQLPSLPIDISASPSIFQHGRDILLCGGKNNLYDCLKLDIRNATWSHFNSMNQPKSFSTVIQMKTETYIVGGEEGNSKYSNDFLQHCKNGWQNGPKLPNHGLDGACGVMISDTLFLLAGGFSTPKQIQIFDTSNKLWYGHVIQLQQGRAFHQCIVFKNKIIITGGLAGGLFDYLDSTEIIDIDGRKLTLRNGPFMNDRRDNHGMGIVSKNDTPTMIVFGGRNSRTQYLNTVEEWDDINEEWLLSDLTLTTQKCQFGFATLPIELICPQSKP